MHALLRFLKTTFHFIGTIASTDLLLQLADCLPKTLATIKKCFRRQDDYTEYAVSPKCSHYIFYPGLCH